MHKIFDVLDEDEVKLVYRIETLVERAFPELFAIQEKGGDRSPNGRRLSFSGEEKTVITEAAVLNNPPRESSNLGRRSASSSKPVDKKRSSKAPSAHKAPSWPMSNLAFIAIILATITLIWAFLR